MDTVQFLMKKSLKSSTHRTYSSAQKKYLNFCKKYDLVSVPADEETLTCFVAFLYLDGLKGSSIRVYLSAVRSLHIWEGYNNPLGGPRLGMVVRGAMVCSDPPDRKLPITFDILSELCSKAKKWDGSLMLISAMTLAFFGCMRAGELCVNDNDIFNTTVHLCREDVTINEKEKSFSLFLKASKTDRLRNGVTIHVGCS